MEEVKGVSQDEMKRVKQLGTAFGGFLPALAALVAVFAIPHVLNDHRKEYNAWGHELGAWIYDATHSYDPNR